MDSNFKVNEFIISMMPFYLFIILGFIRLLMHYEKAKTDLEIKYEKDKKEFYFPISFFIKTKITLCLSLIYLILIIYPFLGINKTWFFNKNKDYSFIYFFGFLALILSRKLFIFAYFKNEPINLIHRIFWLVYFISLIIYPALFNLVIINYHYKKQIKFLKKNRRIKLSSYMF